MYRKPRWIQNAEARDRSRMERLRLWSIIMQCENGNFEKFSFLKLHYSLDQYRVTTLMAETLHTTTTDADKKYGEWLWANADNNEPGSEAE